MSVETKKYEVIEYVSEKEIHNLDRSSAYWSKWKEAEWADDALEMLDVNNEKDKKIYTMILRMATGIAGVRSLHFENPHKNGCDACGDSWNQIAWPCATLRELDDIAEDLKDFKDFSVTTILTNEDGEEIDRFED